MLPERNSLLSTLKGSMTRFGRNDLFIPWLTKISKIKSSMIEMVLKLSWSRQICCDVFKKSGVSKGAFVGRAAGGQKILFLFLLTKLGEVGAGGDELCIHVEVVVDICICSASECFGEAWLERGVKVGAAMLRWLLLPGKFVGT